MLINFMLIDNFTTRPIVLGNNTVECVTTYKLLGIIISNNLSGTSILITYRKKYSLRILKKVSVNREGIFKDYLTTIRPIPGGPRRERHQVHTTRNKLKVLISKDLSISQ